MDFTIIIIVLQLIFLEGILSIDNAAIIGAMAAPLPSDQAVQWPRFLQAFGKWLHPFIGNQRTAALRIGLLGAYLGRGLMLFAATYVIENPWLKLIGAAYLIYLAFENLGDVDADGQADINENKKGTLSFWSVVLTIEIMDLVFSIDNVVAAVALSDKLWVVMLGVGIGILTMRFAAGIFSYAVEREPILKQAAYILILNIGLELILEDVWHIAFNDLTRFLISAATIILAIVYARVKFLHVLRPAFIWIAQGMGIASEFIHWAFAPITGIFKLILKILKAIFGRKHANG